MKQFLIEYDMVSISERLMEIIWANSTEDAWRMAMDQSRGAGYSEGNFDMYQILRNPDGDLYLADLFGDAIRSAGRM